MSSRKITHITTVHPISDPRIYYKECMALERVYGNVSLIAPRQEQSVPLNGIRISGIRIAKNRLDRIGVLSWIAFRSAIREKAAIYHFHDPELMPVGLLLRLFGKKVIYDAHEDLAKQSLHKHWIPRPFRGVVAFCINVFEKFSSRLFSAIVAATPQIGKKFQQRKTIVVQNFPEPGEYDCSKIPYRNRKNYLAYVGSISSTRGLFEMIAALPNIAPQYDARLIMAGRFSPLDLKQQVSCMPGWGSVDYRGRVEKKEVVEILSQCKLGLVVLHPTPAYLESYPLKMFEYMAAGIPIVASDFPLWRTIVHASGCGLLVDPRSPQAIAEAVEYILSHPDEAQNMGLCGIEAVAERFNWRNEESKLLALYQQLL